jgi:hypothetical protein
MEIDGAIFLTMLRIYCCEIHRFTFGRTQDCCYSLDSDYRILVTHNPSIAGIGDPVSLVLQWLRLNTSFFSFSVSPLELLFACSFRSLVP